MSDKKISDFAAAFIDDKQLSDIAHDVEYSSLRARLRDDLQDLHSLGEMRDCQPDRQKFLQMNEHLVDRIYGTIGKILDLEETKNSVERPKKVVTLTIHDPELHIEFEGPDAQLECDVMWFEGSASLIKKVILRVSTSYMSN